MSAVAMGRHIDYSSPRGYYLDYSEWADRAETMDANRPAGEEPEASSLVVARAALGCLEVYLGGGSSDHRDRFESLSRWLVENQELVPGSFGGWAMPAVPRALRGQLKNGWFSGSTHAECVSVLVRAALLLRLEGAAGAARRAFGAFCTGVEDGGFLREIGDEGHEAGLESLAFIEEYPLPDRPCMVLDTHVKGLWATYDYLRLEHDHAAESLFRRCLRGLEFVLDHYDLGYWTRRDLDRVRPVVCPATPESARRHALMLAILHEMTGDPGLADASERWGSYLTSRANRARARLGRTWSGLTNIGGRAIPA